MRGFTVGDGKNKRWLTVGTWACKYENRQNCVCCQPPNVAWVGILKDRAWREYFSLRIIESGKSRVPRRG